MKNILIASSFIILISLTPLTSYGLANTPWIPPTNAFAKAGTSNGTVHAGNYSSWLNFLGSNGITIQSNDLAKRIFINSITNSFNPIHTSNHTISAVNYSTPLTFQGLKGIQVTASDHTIYFNNTVVNGTVISPITCPLNSQLHQVTAGGVFTCAANNSTSSSYVYLNTTSSTTSYNALSTDNVILINATKGNFTVTLPNVSVLHTGREYTIKKIDNSKNYVEIIPTSSTIDYFKNANLTNPMDSLTIINNGTTWFKENKLIFTDTSNILKKATNSWFGSWVNQGLPTTLSISNDTLYAVPFKLSRGTSLAKIESEITTPGTFSNCRMAIYTDSGAGYPLNKISGSDVGALTTQTRTARTIINNFTSNIVLPEGQYYLGIDCNALPFTPASDTITADVITSPTIACGVTTATQTISVTVGNNPNRALFVGISYGKTSSPNNNNNVISTVKIGATSFTKAINSTKNNATTNFSYDSEFWYLKNPSTGANTITITPVTTTTYYIVTSVYSLFNINQTAQVGVTTGNGSTTRTSAVTLTPTNTGAWLLENIAGTTTAAGVNQLPVAPSDTQAWNSLCGASGALVGASEYKTAPVISSANKMTWQFNLPANLRQVTEDIGIEIKPSKTTTPGTMPIVRSIPTASLGPFLGMPQTMGGTNGGTMYSTSYVMGASLAPLPDPFPTSGTISTTDVPEILFNVVG